MEGIALFKISQQGEKSRETKQEGTENIGENIGGKLKRCRTGDSNCEMLKNPKNQRETGPNNFLQENLFR